MLKVAEVPAQMDTSDGCVFTTVVVLFDTVATELVTELQLPVTIA